MGQPDEWEDDDFFVDDFYMEQDTEFAEGIETEATVEIFGLGKVVGDYWEILSFVLIAAIAYVARGYFTKGRT